MALPIYRQIKLVFEWWYRTAPWSSHLLLQAFHSGRYMVAGVMVRAGEQGLGCWEHKETGSPLRPTPHITATYLDDPFYTLFLILASLGSFIDYQWQFFFTQIGLHACSWPS